MQAAMRCASLSRKQRNFYKTCSNSLDARAVTLENTCCQDFTCASSQTIGGLALMDPLALGPIVCLSRNTQPGPCTLTRLVSNWCYVVSSIAGVPRLFG